MTRRPLAVVAPCRAALFLDVLLDHFLGWGGSATALRVFLGGLPFGLGLAHGGLPPLAGLQAFPGPAPTRVCDRLHHGRHAGGALGDALAGVRLARPA